MGPVAVDGEQTEAGAGDRDGEWSEGEESGPKRRRGLWSSHYLSKFTKLLSANTVVLQSLQGYPRDDPVHQLRVRALEHMRQELGMATVPELKQRILTFKRFAGSKLRYHAERSGAHAKPETILRAAPRWLRDLEPHLNLWTQLFCKSRKMRNQTGGAAPAAAAQGSGGGAATQQGGGGAETPQGGGGAGTQWSGDGAALALELVASARALRSLDARAVCRRVRVPPDKRDELQIVWWRMLDVVRRKLALQRDGGGAETLRFSAVESLLADLLLLFDDTLCTLSDSGDYDCMQGLVGLFHLAQLYRLEEPPVEGVREEEFREEMATRWRHAHCGYKARTVSLRGTCRSLVLLQRCWHELKTSARRAVQSYTNPAPPPPPSPLHTALVKRFPHVVTAPLPSWRALVNAGVVIEDTAQSDDDVSELEAERDVGLVSVSMLSARDLAHYRHERTAKEEEDDLVLIEKEIETIDLINVADEGQEAPPAPLAAPAQGTQQHYAFHDHVKQQLKNKGKNFASRLEKELDEQLKDIQLHEGVSEMTLLQESRPRGTPLFIYDSESDGDVQCTEDRNQNIEMIASTLNADEELGVKLEAPSPSPPPAPHPGADEGSDHNCDTIDEKLLMDARVVLVRVDGPGWRPPLPPLPPLPPPLLPVPPLAPLTPLPPRSRKRSHSADCTDPTVKVKIERIDEEHCDEPRGRQVKTMAKKLISEMMREESASNNNNNKKKKVQLPNIDEVRKNNMSILTAQVAPLTTDGVGGALPLEAEGGLPSGEGDSGRISIESAGSLRIDETGGAPDDVTLTSAELQRALARLDGERGAAGTAAAGGKASQFCCTARRQRALNAARRRMAARKARPPPAPQDIHGASACGREGRCTCCCRHLLTEQATAARLQREAEDIAAALRRLLPADRPRSDDNNLKTDKSKKSSRSQTVREPAQEPALNPLQEWQRQKTLNRQYFDLNLMKPQRKDADSPQPPTEPSKKPDSTPDGAPDASAPTYARILPKPPAPAPALPALAPRQTPKIPPGTKVKPSNVTVVPISDSLNHFNTTKSINTSVKLITAPSKQLPGGTLVKLSSLSPPTSKRGRVVVSSNRGKIIVSNSNQMKLVSSASILKKIAAPASNQGKIVTLASSQGKIANLSSSQGNIVPLATSQGKIVTLSSSQGNIVPLASSQGKIANLSSSQGKIVTLASSQGNIGSLASSQGKIISLATSQGNIGSLASSQGKVVPLASKLGKIVPLAPNQEKIFVSTSNHGKLIIRKLAPPASNQGKAVSPNQIKLSTSSIIPTIANKQNTPMEFRLVSRRVPAKANKIPSPVKIAPKPTPVPAHQGIQPPGQGTQAMPGRGEQATAGQGDQAALGQGDQATEGQGSPALEVVPRGTGMKVIKISSSCGSLPLVSSPRSLLVPAPARVLNGESHETAFSSPLLGEGAVLTELKCVKNMSSARIALADHSITTPESPTPHTHDTLAPAGCAAAATPAAPSPAADLEPSRHFQRRDVRLPLEQFLAGADLTMLVLQCVEEEVGVLTPLDGHYVLSEAEPSRAFLRPSYWTLDAVPCSARVYFEVNKDKSSAEGGGGSAVLDAPDKMCLDNKVYVKVKDEPLLCRGGSKWVKKPG